MMGKIFKEEVNNLSENIIPIFFVVEAVLLLDCDQ